ncbi:MAG: hypothetical protein MZV70_19080 [Desulfobacterales bacterium]|nr:hypothetical protein [Desulfobacterales bacterium]
MIYRSIYHFLEHLRVIHTLSDEVELSINDASDNTSLLNLFTLEKSLVYFLSAIQSNGMLIGRLKTSQSPPRVYRTNRSSSSRTSRSKTTSASARPRSTRTFSRA